MGRIIIFFISSLSFFPDQLLLDVLFIAWAFSLSLPGLYWCYNIFTSSFNPTPRKDTKLAKVNYQYEKRQKELEKKRKKEQKEKLKQIRKNVQPPKETDETPQVPQPEK